MIFIGGLLHRCPRRRYVTDSLARSAPIGQDFAHDGKTAYVA
jgi:hypothetical protein